MRVININDNQIVNFEFEGEEQSEEKFSPQEAQVVSVSVRYGGCSLLLLLLLKTIL